MNAEQLRSLVLDSKGIVEVVEHDGAKFEVRSPSFAQRMQQLDVLAGASGKKLEDMTIAEKRDDATVQIKALLSVLVTSVYDEAGNRVFKDNDVDALFAARTGELMRKLMAATRAQLDENGRNLGKDSGGTGSSNSPA
jgi:hypothetical protein